MFATSEFGSLDYIQNLHDENCVMNRILLLHIILQYKSVI